MTTPTPDREYPPDPQWGTDARGQFRYMDYDGEQIRIWRTGLGDLRIDKRGEGPVFIREQDIPIIIEAINDKRTPRMKRRAIDDNADA